MISKILVGGVAALSLSFGSAALAQSAGANVGAGASAGGAGADIGAS